MIDWHESFIFGLAKTGHQFYVVEPKVLGMTRIDGKDSWQTNYRPIPSNVHLISELAELREVVHAQKTDLALAIAFLDMAFFKHLPIPKMYFPITVFLGEFSTLGNLYPEKQTEIYEYIRGLLPNYFLAFTTREVMEKELGDSKLPAHVFDTYNAIPLEDYGPYVGDIPKVLRVGNFLKEREEFNYSLFSEVTKDMPHTILGNNPHLPNARIADDWDDLRQALCRHRVFFATNSPRYDFVVTTAQLEAMASGMPVVTTPYPSCVIKDGENGFVSSDPQVLRERLLTLLDDQELAVKLGKRARQTISEMFNFEKYKSEWNKIFNLAFESFIPRRNSFKPIIEEPQIELEGPLLSGIDGESNQGIAHALRTNRIPLVMHPKQGRKTHDKLMAPILDYFKTLEIAGQSLLHTKPAPFRLVSPFDGHPKALSENTKSITYLPWDYGALPKSWVSLVQNGTVEEIWVNSATEKKFYQAQGIPEAKLAVFARGFDPERLNPSGRKLHQNFANRFVFLFVGTTGLEEGGNLALDAYIKEFKPADNVALLYLATAESASLFKKLESLSHTGTCADIAFATTNSIDTLPLFYRMASFGIVSHCGLNFPRFLPHFIGHALPLAISGYGAGLDIQRWGTYHAIPTSTHFIDETLFPEPLTGKPFLGKPDVESLQRIMRYAFEHPVETRIRGLLGRKKGLEELAWRRVAQNIVSHLNGKTRKQSEESVQLNVLLDHQESEFWLSNGIVHSLYDEWEQTRGFASKSLERNPNNLLTKAVLLEANAALGSFETSLFSEILSMKDYSDVVFLHLVKATEHAKTEESLDKLLQNRKHPYQHLLAALGLYETNRHKKAIRVCRDVISNHPDAEAHAILGMFLENEDPEEAMVHFEKAFELEPYLRYLEPSKSSPERRLHDWSRTPE